MEKIILVANPGGASRKYALFQGDKELFKLHFESEDGKVVYTVVTENESTKHSTSLSHVTFAAAELPKLLIEYGGIEKAEDISGIALRVVAPSTYFQKERVLDKPTLHRLTLLSAQAPIHVHATVSECHMLKRMYPKQKIIGVSDSAFLAERPEKALYYGIPLKDSKTLDLKRFGYHGLSIESVMNLFSSETATLPHRLVVCHLGSGASVVAVKNGKCIDSTMGYSPNEGLLMATRSGSVDYMVTEHMKRELGMSTSRLEEYLNNRSGLLGVSGFSDDIRELLKKEHDSQDIQLALEMYVYKIQKAIGEMSAALGGVDGLVFTGTVGERNSELRRRIVSKLLYLGLQLDGKANHEPKEDKLTRISPAGLPAKVFIARCDEETQMARKATAKI